VEVQAGNFSSWKENRERTDAFLQAENEKHLKEIGKLKAAADRSSRWAERNENTKIGFDPVKEHDRSIATRSFIGAKTKKMQARVKSYEKRMDREIAEKEGLLQDLEEPIDLKVMPMEHYKKVLIDCKDLTLRYTDGTKPVVNDLSFDLLQGERVFFSGENGSGKSTLIKSILATAGVATMSNLVTEGTLNVAPNLVISYINQDTSWLRGSLRDYALKNGLDYSLFLSILSQLDMSRIQFEKNIEDYSEGQKKKVLIAGSLLTSAHLYIWDEPLNYIDVFSRMQIEKLIEEYKPTMLLVEHDVRFREKLATKEITL
jgi:lincosamide and streptogramin A transport system ATP-binding/permease protein